MGTEKPIWSGNMPVELCHLADERTHDPLTGLSRRRAPEWQIKGIGDVNGDSKEDVIWQHTITGTVAVRLMNGLKITATGSPGAVSTNWDIQ